MAKRVRSGSIPRDIVYVYSVSSVIKVGNTEKEVVRAEVSPVDNERILRGAEDWATSCARDKGTVQKRFLENTPIEGLRVIALAHHGSGNSYYRVLAEGGLCFELTEDVFFESATTEGILPGGILAGKFVWANLAGYMRLVRVGSELYQGLLEAGNRAMLRVIPKKKLVVGGVYDTKSGVRGIFLGVVDSVGYQFTKSRVALVRTVCESNQAWLELPERESHDPSGWFERFLANPQPYHLDIRPTRPVVNLVETVEVPTNYIERVQQKFARKAEVEILADIAKRGDSAYTEYDLVRNSTLYQMHSPETPSPDLSGTYLGRVDSLFPANKVAVPLSRIRGVS